MTASASRTQVSAKLGPWLVIAAGLTAMYLPTLLHMYKTVWTTDEQGHGPIVLAVSAWLIWQRWPAVTVTQAIAPRPALAWPLLLFGTLLYVVGRSQRIDLFEVASIIVVLSGLTLLMLGVKQLRELTFPLLFLFFVMPLPGSLVDAVTQPMKIAVSYVAEHVLFLFQYPVARSGVTLQVGPYQLLVADACAGLHTLFSLEALGLLYLHVVKHSSTLRNVLLAILIVPISFTANVIRVVTLTLITYHLGDEAGQGFLHGFAGMVLFITALLLIMSADSLVRRVSSRGPIAQGTLPT